MSNLQPGDRIRVEDQAGKRILSALPSETGIAGLTLLFEGKDAPSELSLELDGIINENQEPRKMEIRQTLYAHRSSVPAPLNLQRLSFDKDGKRNLLVYSSLHEEHKLDVSAPTVPVLQGLIAESEHIVEETQVIHREQQIASSITQHEKTLELLRPRLGNILAIGNPPRIGELKKTLYVGMEQGGELCLTSQTLKILESSRNMKVNPGLRIQLFLIAFSPGMLLKKEKSKYLKQ